MKKTLLVILTAICLVFSIASVAVLAQPSEQTSPTWTNVGIAQVTENEDGTITATANSNPFERHFFVTPASLGEATLTDVSYTYHAKFGTVAGGESVYTFNFGIVDGYAINIAFYIQNIAGVGMGWTNTVLHGGFSDATYTLRLYKNGEPVVPGGAVMGPTTSLDWTTAGIIAWVFDSIGLKAYDAAEGHDFVFRATLIEGGVRLRVYYGGAISDTSLIYELKIESSAAPTNLANTYYGTGFFNGTMTLTQPQIANEAAVDEPVVEEPVNDGSTWTNVGIAQVTENEDGTITATANSNPFERHFFVTPASLGEATLTDVSYTYHAKFGTVAGGESVYTFNFGIVDGYAINIAFYIQNIAGVGMGWTNTVLHGGFSDATYTLRLYKNGEPVVPGGAVMGPTTSLDWTTAGIIAWVFDSIGLKAYDAAEGHDFVFRATLIEGGVRLRIYYGSEISAASLIYDLKIESSAAPTNLANTYYGTGFFNGTMTLTQPQIAKVTVGEDPGFEEPDVDENGWHSLNPMADLDLSNMDQTTLQGSLVLNNMDAETAGFFDPHAGVPIRSLLGGTVDPAKDVAVTFTMQASGAGEKYSTEMHFWMYLYSNNANLMGIGILNQNKIFTNAVTRAAIGGVAVPVVGIDKDGNMIGGTSDKYEGSIGSLIGSLTGSAGRERTFTIVYSVIDGVGVMQKMYLHGRDAFDLATAPPIYTCMIYTTNTAVFNYETSLFAVRFFNTNVTLSNVSAVQVDKAQEYPSGQAEINGDMGIWTPNTNLIAGKYTANADGSIRLDDTLTSNSTAGLFGIKAKLDEIAGDKDYKTENDFVVKLHVNVADMEREMTFWFNLIDENGEYVSIGLFYQYINNEYQWTSSIVFSSPGNPISGYVYETLGKTSSTFENQAYNFSGIMAVPAVAGFSPIGNEDGHTFYIRYKNRGNNLEMGLYYEFPDREVNFKTDEELYKVVIYDYAIEDWSKMSFGYRGQRADSTVNSCTIENFSALYEASPDLPTPPPTVDDDPQGGNQGNDNDEDGNGGKVGCGSSIAFGGLGFAAVLLIAAALIVCRKRRE